MRQLCAGRFEANECVSTVTSEEEMYERCRETDRHARTSGRTESSVDDHAASRIVRALRSLGLLPGLASLVGPPAASLPARTDSVRPFGNVALHGAF